MRSRFITYIYTGVIILIIIYVCFINIFSPKYYKNILKHQLNSYLLNYSFSVRNPIDSIQRNNQISEIASKIIHSLNNYNELYNDDITNKLYLSLLLERMNNYTISDILKDSIIALDLTQIQNTSQSINILNDILNCELKESIVYHNLGWLYFIYGNRELCIENIKKSIELDPNNCIYHISLGLIFEKCGLINESFFEFNRALCLNSNILYSKFFEDLNNRKPGFTITLIFSCIDTLNSYLKKQYSPIIGSRIGSFYYFLNNYDSAKMNFINSNTTLPNLPLNYYYLGMIAKNENHIDSAKFLFRVASFISNYEYLPAYELSKIYKENNDSSECVFFARLALERYRDEIIESNKNVSDKYLVNYYCDTFIPKNLYYYLLPILKLEDISAILAEEYIKFKNPKLSHFFRYYTPLYVAHPINEIGNMSFKQDANKAFELIKYYN